MYNLAMSTLLGHLETAGRGNFKSSTELQGIVNDRAANPGAGAGTPGALQGFGYCAPTSKVRDKSSRVPCSSVLLARPADSARYPGLARRFLYMPING